MATLAMIKRFEEGTDLLAEVQQDVQDIESSDFTTIEQGWNDLSLALMKESEYSDLFSDPYSVSKGFVSKTTTDAQTYLENETIQVQRPNWDGNPDDEYINLYSGTASWYNDGSGDFSDNFDNETYDPDTGYYTANPASVWDLLSGKVTNLINDSGDAYWDNGGGRAAGLGKDSCKWGESTNFTWFDEWDGSGTDDGMYSTASGSVAQWAPYIHVSGGDHSALDADAFLI